MYKLLSSLVLCAVILVSTLQTKAYAQDPGAFNIYAAAKLGYTATFTEIKRHDTSYNSATLSSFNFGGAIGGQYYFLPPFGLRLEAEYLYRTADKSKKVPLGGTFSAGIQTILTNVYFDWYVMPQLAVYTSAGIGLSIIDLELELPSSGTTKYNKDFSWQVGIGFWYAVTNRIIIDTNVRYIAYSTSNTTVTVNTNKYTIPMLSSVEAMLSIRYLF